MYQHVMALLDGSKLGICVLTHLDAMAEKNLIQKATLVTVEEAFHIPGGLEYRLDSDERKRLEERGLERSREYLDTVAKRLNYEGTVVETEDLQGGIASELVDFAKTNAVDLIIVSTHGRSSLGPSFWGRVRRLHWWSMIDHLLRHCGVPVLLVRPPDVKW